ncbi:unnamed protein product [Musa acuminata subsp. burmannicoides]
MNNHLEMLEILLLIKIKVVEINLCLICFTNMLLISLFAEAKLDSNLSYIGRLQNRIRHWLMAIKIG